MYTAKNFIVCRNSIDIVPLNAVQQFRAIAQTCQP